MGKVVVLGSIITDLVARAPRLPHPGESLFGDEFGTFLGGKGINQAIAAARQGAKVTMIGCVGTDAFGDAFFPVLAREGINSAHVARSETEGTGVSTLIIAADSGQNMIVVTPRANLTISAEVVETALHAAQAENKTSIFLAQCETSRVSWTTGLRLARTLSMTTLLNAAPIPREGLDDELFSLVDILVVNEVEAAALAGMTVNSRESATMAAEQLLTRGPKHVIITLGSQGSLYSIQGAHPEYQASFPVKAVDSTAAGDAFCGMLAACIADGLPMNEALRRASAAGALTTTRKGAIDALPTAAEVEGLLAR